MAEGANQARRGARRAPREDSRKGLDVLGVGSVHGVMSEAITRVDELLSHAGWLRGLACRLVGEAGADDAVQEVWLKATQRPPVGLESPRGWLRSALRSVHLRKLERRDAAAARERAVARVGARVGARAEALGEGLPSAEEMAERAEAQRLLVGAVLRLGEPERQAVLLHFFEGLSAAEIARRSGVPSSTVRTRIARGVGSLRERLDVMTGGRAAWVPALSLLTPPSGGVITPTLISLGTLFMWKLGALFAGLALAIWTGFHFLDGDGSGAATAPQDGDVATAPAIEVAAAPKESPTTFDGGIEPQPSEGERVPAGAAVSPEAPAPESVSPPEEGIVLVGRVLDPNGRPVPGAMVFEGTLAQVNLALRFPARPQRPSTQAGEGGRFRFELDPGGGAIFCAQADGFADSEEYLLDLSRSSVEDEMTLQLRYGAAVTGVVYGKDQQTVVGRDVRISSQNLGEYQIAVTDEEGRYLLEDLIPGPWRAATFPSDQELLDAGESTEVASVMAQLKQAEFTLVGGEAVDVPLGLVSVDAPHVHGVLLHNGKPIGGMMQWYPAARSSEKMVSRANEKGQFEVDLPAPGTWIVHVNAPDTSSRGQRRFYSLAAGERRQVKIDLRGGRVLGRVIDSQGEPIKGVRLELHTVGGGAHLPIPFLGDCIAWSDGDGRYEFGLLLPGAYVVVAHGSAPGAKGGKRCAARSQALEIAGTGDVEASPLLLRDGASFEISVTLANGSPASGASLFFHDADGHCLNPTTNTRSSKGKATSPAFAPGPIWVTATHERGSSRTVAVDVGTDGAVELVIEGDYWMELDGGTDWIDETSGHVAIIDGGGRRWGGFVDINRLFEARPSPKNPRGPLIGPLPGGSYTIRYERPGQATRHGSVELMEGSPQVSAVLLR